MTSAVTSLLRMSAQIYCVKTTGFYSPLAKMSYNLGPTIHHSIVIPCKCNCVYVLLSLSTPVSFVLSEHLIKRTLNHRIYGIKCIILLCIGSVKESL